MNMDGRIGFEAAYVVKHTLPHEYQARLETNTCIQSGNDGARFERAPRQVVLDRTALPSDGEAQDRGSNLEIGVTTNSIDSDECAGDPCSRIVTDPVQGLTSPEDWPDLKGEGLRRNADQRTQVH